MTISQAFAAGRAAVFCVALVAWLPLSATAQSTSPSVLVRQLMGVWETGDVAPLTTIFHPDAVYVDKPNARELVGLDEIRGYVGHVHSWASGVRIAIQAVRGGADFAVAEWVMTGVQDRPIAGMIPVATGQPFSIQGTTLVDFADGRVSRAVDYIQVVPLMLQLGGRIELPGGVVIGGAQER